MEKVEGNRTICSLVLFFIFANEVCWKFDIFQGMTTCFNADVDSLICYWSRVLRMCFQHNIVRVKKKMYFNSLGLWSGILIKWWKLCNLIACERRCWIFYEKGQRMRNRMNGSRNSRPNQPPRLSLRFPPYLLLFIYFSYVTTKCQDFHSNNLSLPFCWDSGRGINFNTCSFNFSFLFS